MSSSRTKCVSTKLTEAEYAALERAAGTQTLSAWARTVLLRAAALTLAERAGGEHRDRLDRTDPPRMDARGDDPGEGRRGLPDRAASWAHGPVCGTTPRDASRSGSTDWSSWDPDRTAPGTLTRSPVWLLAMLVLACLSGVGIGAYRYVRVWTPLQREYLSSYVWSAVAISRSGWYELLVIVDQTTRRTALDADVVPAPPTPGRERFALKAAAITGTVRLVWERSEWDHSELHAYLRQWVYQDQTLRDLVQPALWGAMGVLMAALVPVVSDEIAVALIRRATRSAWERSARGSNRVRTAWHRHLFQRKR